MEVSNPVSHLSSNTPSLVNTQKSLRFHRYLGSSSIFQFKKQF